MNKLKLKNEERCARAIVSGLVHYYFSKRVQNLRVDFEFKEDCLRVISEGRVNIKPDDLERLNTLSNALRLPEFDNYYEELIGTGCCEQSDIDTLGSMVDEAIVSYSEDGLLSILLIRKF